MRCLQLNKNMPIFLILILLFLISSCTIRQEYTTDSNISLESSKIVLTDKSANLNVKTDSNSPSLEKPAIDEAKNVVKKEAIEETNEKTNAENGVVAKTEINEGIKTETGEEIKSETKIISDGAFVGKWRIYSQAIFYDQGGNDWLDTPSTQLLEIKEDGTWTFGSSSGMGKISMIESQDWLTWAVSSYGPTRKIVLDGWNKGVADGPIEESEERVDFIWVIYHMEPPSVTWPGIVQIKFGHTNDEI